MPKHVWAIRVRLEISECHRDLALFDLAIDSKLRGCDLVKLMVADVYASGHVRERASIIQSKTQRPVSFEITEGTSKSLSRWMEEPLMVGSDYLWPGRFHERLHISTRQYARLVRDWVSSIGLDPTSYGTHSMRRTKVALGRRHWRPNVDFRRSISCRSAAASKPPLVRLAAVIGDDPSGLPDDHE